MRRWRRPSSLGEGSETGKSKILRPYIDTATVIALSLGVLTLSCPSAQLQEFNEELEKDKEKFRNGPISNRSITDCICCLIFIVAIVGFCAASAYGWINGDPRKLLIGWDSDGNGCGYSDKTKDYEHLYWAQPPDVEKLKSAITTMNLDEAMGILSTGTCVKECPTTTSQIECV